MPNAIYYKNHCQRYIEQAQTRIAVARKLMDDAKCVPCVGCNKQFPVAAMDFDHVDGTKEIAVSQMHTYSIKRIEAEIAKCEIRCANCHRVKHWPEKEEHASS